MGHNTQSRAPRLWSSNLNLRACPISSNAEISGELDKAFAGELNNPRILRAAGPIMTSAMSASRSMTAYSGGRELFYE